MKTFADYLKENKSWTYEFRKFNHSTRIWDSIIISVATTDEAHMILDNEKCTFFPKEMDITDLLNEYLYCKYKLEVRFCEVCGKPYDAGYIVGNGYWYCCEDCFETAMDCDYGKGKWRAAEEEGIYDGWYEYLNDNGEWEDTGVYYTEWN